MTQKRPPELLSLAGVRRRVARIAGDPGIRQALTIVLALRVGLGVVAWVGLMVAPAAVIAGRQLPQGSGGLTGAVVDPWQRWDSWHFETIAESGYPRGTLEVAFLPLYPTLLRLVAPLVGGSTPLAGLCLSTVAAAAGLVLLHRRVAADLGEVIAGRTVLYLGLAPTAMFLMAPYTEALFLALSAAAFVALRARRLGVAGVVIAAAALTRPQGLLLLVPAAVEVWPDLRVGWRRPFIRHIKSYLFLTSAPLVGFGAWTLWCQSQVGVTTFTAEARGWGGHPAWPWQGLIDGLASTGAYPGPVYNAATVAVWIALLVVLARHRDRVPASYIAYAAVSLVPIIVREEGFGNPWASAPRFALVVFPLFVALAVLTQRRPRLHAAWTVISAVLGATALLVFTHNQFVA